MGCVGSDVGREEVGGVPGEGERGGVREGEAGGLRRVQASARGGDEDCGGSLMDHAQDAALSILNEEAEE